MHCLQIQIHWERSVQDSRGKAFRETDFMCEDCGEKFNMEDNIGQQGRRMHKEGGSFACPDCQKIFTAYPNMSKHIKHSHEEEAFLALFANAASLGEISSRLMWQSIQRQQISCVMIMARNAI